MKRVTVFSLFIMAMIAFSVVVPNAQAFGAGAYQVQTGTVMAGSGTGIPATGDLDARTAFVRLTSLNNYALQDVSGNQIGQVNDFVINLIKSRVDYIVATVNGRTVLVPWASLSNVTAQNTAFVFKDNVSRLQNAPDFNSNNVNFGDPLWSESIVNYWRFGSTNNQSNQVTPVATVEATNSVGGTVATETPIATVESTSTVSGTTATETPLATMESTGVVGGTTATETPLATMEATGVVGGTTATETPVATMESTGVVSGTVATETPLATMEATSAVSGAAATETPVATIESTSVVSGAVATETPVATLEATSTVGSVPVGNSNNVRVAILASQLIGTKIYSLESAGTSSVPNTGNNSGSTAVTPEPTSSVGASATPESTASAGATGSTSASTSTMTATPEATSSVAVGASNSGTTNTSSGASDGDVIGTVADFVVTRINGRIRYVLVSPTGDMSNNQKVTFGGLLSGAVPITGNNNQSGVTTSTAESTVSSGAVVGTPVATEVLSTPLATSMVEPSSTTTTVASTPEVMATADMSTATTVVSTPEVMATVDTSTATTVASTPEIMATTDTSTATTVVSTPEVMATADTSTATTVASTPEVMATVDTSTATTVVNTPESTATVETSGGTGSSTTASGDLLVPVPMSVLYRSLNNNQLVLRMSPFMLRNAPVVSTGAFPNAFGFGWDAGVQDYWITGWQDFLGRGANQGILTTGGTPQPTATP